jgi:hypothetical protein
MPVSAMLMTGGVVFYNYLCGGMIFVAGGNGNKNGDRKSIQTILL